MKEVCLYCGGIGVLYIDGYPWDCPECGDESKPRPDKLEDNGFVCGYCGHCELCCYGQA